MARVAFFAEHLSPTQGGYLGHMSACLIQGLSDNQHEVKVCTSYEADDELPLFNSRVEVIRPFRSWSVWEIPRLLPSLLAFQPDVIHLAPGQKPGRLLHAMNFLPQALRHPFRPVIALSLFEVPEPLSVSTKHLIAMSDIVLVANEFQKNTVSALKESHSRQLIQVLPPPAEHKVSSEPNSLWFTNLWPHFVYVPAPPQEHDDFETLVKGLSFTLTDLPDVGVVFGGSWKGASIQQRKQFEKLIQEAGLQERVVFPADLSPQQEEEAIAQSSLVYLASLKLSSFYLTRILRQSRLESRPVLISDLQARFDAFSWTQKHSAFISSRSLADQLGLLKTIFQDPSQLETISQNLTEELNHTLFDAPGNLLSRLYQQVRT